MSESKKNSKYIFGIIFILIGILWLLNNLNLIIVEIPDFIFTWPSILILIGVILLFSSNSKVPGTVLILIGAYFLIPEIFPDISHKKLFEIFLPIILILIGLSILLKRDKKKVESTKVNDKFSSARNVSSSEIKEKVILGEDNINVDSINFKGGTINTVLGSTNIDLRNTTTMSDIINLEVSVVLGELNIYIPKEWSLENQISKTLAEITDRRALNPTIITTKKLIVSGKVILGEIVFSN